MERNRETLLKILLDEDVRGKGWDMAIQRLKDERHDVVSVYDESHGMRGRKDHELGRIASEEQRLILTRDKTTFQFENFRRDQKLPFGLVTLELDQLSPEARAERISTFVQQEGAALHDNCTVLEPASERIKPMEQAYQEFQQNTLEQAGQAQEHSQTPNNSMKP